MRKAFILAVIASSISLAGPTSAANIGGVGTQRCEVFNNNVRDLVIAPGNISWEQYAYAWAQGWLSRKNIERESRGLTPVPDITPSSFGSRQQMEFLSNYCRANPNNIYVDGVDQIYRKLLEIYSLIG